MDQQPEEDSHDDLAIELTETPFNPKQGIWFKYGTVFRDRAEQIRTYETHHGVKLPADFLEMIGDYCEGGFDGWYQVHKGDHGSICWMKLIFVKWPDDSERRYAYGHFTIEILERHPALFYREGGKLRYLPFGSATCFRSDQTAGDGFLVFDVTDNYSVHYVSNESPPLQAIAPTFRQMMLASRFQFPG